MDKYFQHAEYLTFNMFTSQSLLKKIGKFCLTTPAVLRVDVPREIFSQVNLLGSATPDPFTLFTQLPCSYLEKIARHFALVWSIPSRYFFSQYSFFIACHVSGQCFNCFLSASFYLMSLKWRQALTLCFPFYQSTKIDIDL